MIILSYLILSYLPVFGVIITDKNDGQNYKHKIQDVPRRFHKKSKCEYYVMSNTRGVLP